MSINNTIKELLERKSVRQFEDKEISDEDRDAILLSAVNAPSPGNQQMYKIIDVKDEKMKEELSILCDNQPFIKKAKLVLVFCADFRKWIDAFKSVGANARDVGIGDMVLAIEDSMIASENAVTAAWALGIGSCYIGDILENREKVTELLKLPKYVFPSTVVVFGYPTEGQMERVKPKRESLKHLVCENVYHESTSEELKEMFMEKQNLTEEEYVSWITAFCNRKFNSDFSKEMERSVNEYFKDYRG